MSDDSTYHRRHLPHYYHSNAVYFVTFCLTGLLPRARVLEFTEERLHLQRKLQRDVERSSKDSSSSGDDKRHLRWLVRVLEKNENCVRWLADLRIADLVADAMTYRDERDYALVAYCVMPTHVHLVFGVGEHGMFEHVGQIHNLSNKPVWKIMHSLKRHTAREANRILGRRGAFWQDESYDRVLRDADEMQRTIEYVLNNPVKAGFVKNWRDWKWCYSRFEI